MNIGNLAFLSIDNIKTFEDKSLGELYVPGGEEVAKQTKHVAELCKQYGVLTINVFESHPEGHISFASSYKNKNPGDTITYQEVKEWTEQNHGLSQTAQFTVAQLQEYLKNISTQQDVLRVDHAKTWTNSHQLMEPLTDDLFDIHIVKGSQVDKHPYGGFGGTELSETLDTRSINGIVIGGVATEYCAGQSALEGIEDGRTVYLLMDAIAPIDPIQGEKMKEYLQEKGVHLITTEQLHDLLIQSHS